MSFAPSWLPALLCSIAFLLPGWALAATKLDLSPYLGQVRMPGDFKVYGLSTGGTRTVTTLDAAMGPKGWAFLVASTLQGTLDSDGTTYSHRFLIPGKQLLDGHQFFDGFSFLVPKPTKGLKLLTSFGKLQRLKSRAALGSNGQRVGEVVRAGGWVAVGYETVATPSGIYPNALVADSVSGLRIVDIFGADIAFFYVERIWYAPIVGTVRVQTSYEQFSSGAFVEKRSWTESLVSGELGGVPFP